MARSKQINRIALPCYVDLESALHQASLVNVCVGPDGGLYALARRGSANDQYVGAGGAMFPKIHFDSPQDFLVLVYDGSQFISIDLLEQSLNYHFAQPLPNGELLLACGRSRYRADNDYDINGRVFDTRGHQVREFLLGDGIEDVQATADGNIWTSYFDEGVFGSFGWSNPVGVSGLRCWSCQGEPVYEYAPHTRDEDLFIADCYALNVCSNKETWIYFYTEFPLIRIKVGGAMTKWSTSVRGASAVAVWQDYALFQGGYDNRDTFELCKLLADGQSIRVARFQFSDEFSRKKIGLTRATGRGPLMHLIDGARVFRVDVAELVTAIL